MTSVPRERRVQLDWINRDDLTVPRGGPRALTLPREPKPRRGSAIGGERQTRNQLLVRLDSVVSRGLLALESGQREGLSEPHCHGAGVRHRADRERRTRADGSSNLCHRPLALPARSSPSPSSAPTRRITTRSGKGRNFISLS